MTSLLIAACIIGVLIIIFIMMDFEWYEAMAIVVGICIIIYFLFKIIFVDHDLQRMLRSHNIEHIFDDIDGFTVSSTDITATYGEIRSNGMGNIYKFARDNNITTIIDVGSGVGKSLVLAKLWGFSTCIGVEKNSFRHMQATMVHKRLPEYLNKSITYQELDGFEYDFTQHKKPFIIYISNLMWPNDLCAKFMQKLVKEVVPGSYIVCSKYAYYETDKPRIRHDKILQTPMSWDRQSQCYVFEIIPI